jgi:hypothetical protein
LIIRLTAALTISAGIEKTEILLEDLEQVLNKLEIGKIKEFSKHLKTVLAPAMKWWYIFSTIKKCYH